jgi:NADH-quinone oxidoreductase subunit E
MTNDPKLVPDVTGMLNLMGHPAAMMATGTALAFGLASHAYGLWAGTVAGSLEASMRMLDMQAGNPAAYRPVPAPVARTRAAVHTLLADAESTAREVAKSTGAVAEKVKAEADAGNAPKSMAKPAKPDDLKAISGIGPKFEQVLNGLGVWTYAQIGAWRKAEIDWIEDYLAFRGRVARDGWIEQAKALAGKAGK